MLDEILRGPLSFHTVAPPALHPFDGLDAAMRELAIALQAQPQRAEIHAAIGNGFIRQTRYLEAIEAYRTAARLDAQSAAARLALAELLFVAKDHRATAALGDALALQRAYHDPEPPAKRTRVAMLLRDASYSVNTPLELIADRSELALDKYYIEEASPAFPADVVFCAFGHSRNGTGIVDRALEFARRLDRPLINDPRALPSIARERLRETLGGIPSVTVVDTRIVKREELRFTGAHLVRPLDTHAGSGLRLIESEEALKEHLELHRACAYHVSPFVEYVSGDGFYRKYRILFVNKMPLPYHLAISPRWMVHYRGTPMARYEWMRSEERAFLAEPRRVFPMWDDALAAVRDRIGLDYFGIDCAMLGDGTLLIFEADAAMLVHDEEPGSVFQYKRPAIDAIRRSLTQMFRNAAYSTS